MVMLPQFAWRDSAASADDNHAGTTVPADFLKQGVIGLYGPLQRARRMLRRGAALVLAALAARGTSIVENIHFIDRGYDRLEEALNTLGAQVERQL